MDSLAPPETLTPDPLLAENSDVVPETLAQTEGNAAGNTPFTAGMFVWAKVKRHPWWPALVSSQLKKDSVLVACFGNEETLAWCEPKQLKPFFKVFDEMSRQSSSKSFLTALHSCVQEVERSLELVLTCNCVPAEARPNPLRGEDSGEIPVANLSPKEFRERIMDVSRNVQAVDVLEAARLRSWVFGFGKVSMQGDSWEFRRRRGNDDLVDKIDLDALPVEMVGGKDEAEEGLAIDSSVGKRRRISMSKLIAEMDLDLEDLDDDDDDDDDDDENDDDKEEKSLRSMKRRGRGKLEAVKAEEEAGSSSGRRERKKSKYLSPPYTNLREVGKFLAMLPRKNSSLSDHGVTTGPSACQDDEEDDNKSSLLKIQRMTTIELLSELLFTAENPLHLKGNRGAKIIKFFFAMYRDSKYSDGADFEDYQKFALESTAKTEDSVEDSRKHELTGSSKDLEVKQQKSNRKHGADAETKLDSVPPKRNRRKEDDLDSKRQRNIGLEKQKPRRKKLLKDRISQGAPIFLDFCNTNSLDAGKAKKKKSRNIMDGSWQGDQVDSDLNLSNASFHVKEKQKLRKRKKLNDTTSKEIPANLDLNMADLSGESKLEKCNKRIKSDADEDSTMAVDPQFVGDLENVVGLDVEPLNCQKLVSVDEKRVGSKENANGKAIQKLDCADARFSELGKSILKKKNASSQPKAKSGRRKVKGVDHPGFPREAALHLTFHSGVALPSTEDLIATYSQYGDLIRNQPVELFEESNSARVLFVKDADAESAFKDKAGPFGSVATLRLHLSGLTADHGQSNHETASSSLQISDAISPVKSTPAKPALPYIRKSLETMISTLAWSSSSPVNSVGSTSDGLKPEARENLVGEMQGLLQKVEKMLNGAGSSS